MQPHSHVCWGGLVDHAGYLGGSTAAITQIPSCLRGVSLVPGCSTALLFLHHTFQLSPEANLARDLRSKPVLQSSSLPQAGSCPCTSAPQRGTDTEVVPVWVCSSSTLHWGRKQVQLKNSCSLHVAAASFPSYEMNHAFILQTVT